MYDIESGEIKINKSSMSEFHLNPLLASLLCLKSNRGRIAYWPITSPQYLELQNQSDSKSGQVEHSIFTLMSETLMTKYPNNTNWRGGLCEKGQSEQGWIKDLEDVRFWRFWGAWQRNHWQKGEQWAKWQQHCRIELRGRLTAELVLK